MMLIEEVERISGVPRSKIYRRIRRDLYPCTVKLAGRAWARYPDDFPQWVVTVEYLIFRGWKDPEIRAFTRRCAKGFTTEQELVNALTVLERIAMARDSLNHCDATFRKVVADAVSRGTMGASP